MATRLPQSSYYDKDFRPSASLYRARQPYLVKNAFTGIAMLGFAISVYTFTIRAVSQDEFEDVKVPDAPVEAPPTSSAVAQ
ncbi:hypothetical protein LTR28_012175 [Elasticomyces elasticus]|nr:hypothetical protein LTR28_012175 [Elasticomyces elasticus]